MKYFIPLLLLVLLLSCQEKKTKDKTLHLATSVRITGIDPVLMGDVYSSTEGGKIYESLYDYDPYKRPYELVPNLAESLPKISADGITYTIRLREDVKFQDSPAFPQGKGRLLEANDVIYSLKRLADPKVGTRAWWLLEGKIKGLDEWRKSADYGQEVPGLQVVEKNTLRITLTKPFAMFTHLLAHPHAFIVSKEAVSHFKEDFPLHPVGTGPFVLKEFSGNKLVYEKNENFREKIFPGNGVDAGRKLPLSDKIIVHIMEESRSSWLSFLKGKLDILAVPPEFLGEKIPDNQGLQTSMDSRLDFSYFGLNNRIKAFADRRVRQAMSLSYDRNDSNKIFYRGNNLIAQGPVPPQLTGHSENFSNPFVKFDVARAKELLKEAGYPEGKGLPEFIVDIDTGTLTRLMAEHFQQQMKRIGIRTKVVSQTFPELTNKITRNEHQIFFYSWSADYPDAENFLMLFTCKNVVPGPNKANFCDPDFDRKFMEAISEKDPLKRSRSYEELNQKVALEMPVIFLFHRRRLTLLQKDVRNFLYTEFPFSQAQYLAK